MIKVSICHMDILFYTYKHIHIFYITQNWTEPKIGNSTIIMRGFNILFSTIDRTIRLKKYIKYLKNVIKKSDLMDIHLYRCYSDCELYSFNKLTFKKIDMYWVRKYISKFQRFKLYRLCSVATMQSN